MDDAALQSDLSVKVFPEQAFSVVGQLEYNPIVGNRSDDNVVVVDGFHILPVSVGIHEKEPLHTGIYTPEQTAKLLQDKYLDQQYFFGTERALSFLHKTQVENV